MLPNELEVERMKASQRIQNLRTQRAGEVEKRRKLFWEKIRYGPIFPCISCHQILFQNGVQRIKQDFISEIQTSIFLRNTLEESLKDPRFNVTINVNTDGSVSKDAAFYCCHTCIRYLKKSRLPPMSIKNNMSIVDLTEHIDTLTSLEESLVAKKLIFQKIFPLRISLMLAIKDKLIMVPITDEDVINTLTKLPRIPSESGLIDVQWKRKLSLKNCHMQARVDVKKIFDFLASLKSLGNPYCQFFDQEDEYRNRCLEEDKENFDNIFPDTNESYQGISNSSNEVAIHNEDCFERREIEAEEENYQKHDVIRKFQIDYDDSVTLTPKYPEAFQEDAQDQPSKLVVIAPGEGKVPESILFCKNWDAMAFPHLLPDGKGNLHENRPIKLDDHMYFKSRLNNINSKFRLNSSYVFAAEYYLAKKSMQRNIDLSYVRGTRKATEYGNVYSLEDGYSVFDNASNTPSFH